MNNVRIPRYLPTFFPQKCRHELINSGNRYQALSNEMRNRYLIHCQSFTAFILVGK